MAPLIDLYSDTTTKPTQAMRAFMCAAEVGDEQRGEDPTTNRLQERVAELLGHEAAVFLPSGTMCNQIAYAVHCVAGDEIVLDKTGHALHAEGAGAAAVAGAQLKPLDGDRGLFTREQFEAAIRPLRRNAPRTRVVSIENTSNLGGGRCWSLAVIRDITAAAKQHGIASHLDGARLLNAQVKTGITARDYAAPFDSAWLDFSKGLGAPVGGVLAGSREFVEAAFRWKHRLGGAMRQSGILAAACLYALDHHVERLADDHANARRFAEGIAGIDGVSVEQPETNIVLFDVGGLGTSAAEFAAELEARGVRVSAMGTTLCRAVTHLDVTAEQCESAAVTVAATARVIESGAGRLTDGALAVRYS